LIAARESHDIEMKGVSISGGGGEFPNTRDEKAECDVR
jgi:hypothetical protein